MSRGALVDIEFVKGKTHHVIFRWAAEPSVFKRITAISPNSPTTFTVPDHGLPNNWDVAVVSAPWLTNLNAVNNPPIPEEYHTATVLSPNSISLDFTRETNWKFKPDGFIRYFTPVDLSGYSGRMQVRTAPGGTLLLEPTVIVSPSENIISVNITPEQTDPLKWSRGLYSLELFDEEDGTVVEIAYGTVVLREQVTA